MLRKRMPKVYSDPGCPAFFFKKTFDFLNNFCTNPRLPLTVKVALLGAQNLSAGPGFFAVTHTIIMSGKTGENQFRAQTGMSGSQPMGHVMMSRPGDVQLGPIPARTSIMATIGVQTLFKHIETRTREPNVKVSKRTIHRSLKCGKPWITINFRITGVNFSSTIPYTYAEE